MKKQEYVEYVEGRAKKSPIIKNCIFAFLIGGLICIIGQGLKDLYIYLGINQEKSGLLSSISLIFLSALLTGLGVFDDIAKFAGAGTLVPITGFANAVAAPAIDDKSEGLVMGVGAQMFTIAGPVIVYGVLTSVIYGVIYWLWGMLV